ncbi:MAG: glycine cleavage system protein GcvH [Tannerella sp.]|jgi:glycine cleavage system H protein|nr:glycine cleavage system protein GcvH [Tannerella sp.]
MNFPKELKYTSDHEWILVQGETALVGITDYAQSQLGEVVFVDIPTEGETVSQAEVFGSIEAVKTVSDLLMPVTGEILEVNPALESHPELVNQSPYNEGWLIKIRPVDPSETESLMSDEAYSELIGE